MSDSSGSAPLPLGILIPTRNCLGLLRRQLASLQAVLGIAEEVVVVDGESDDGSLEFLRANLRHPSLRVESRPRGLYQGWNYGVSLLRSRYLHIATAGDAITVEGLRHLYEVAERYEADVVLSPPKFVREDGTALPRKRWSLHELIEALQPEGPIVLGAGLVFITSVCHGMAGMMGSSASNLYRTSALQERPFPTDYGHVGDTAWGLAAAFALRFAVTPTKCAEFVIHGGGGELSLTQAAEVEARLLTLARATLRLAKSAGRLGDEAGSLDRALDSYETCRRSLTEAMQEYDSLRAAKFLGKLHPAVWQARRRRAAAGRSLRDLWVDSLRQFAPKSA
jgi:hypothetical protein